MKRIAILMTCLLLLAFPVSGEEEKPEKWAGIDEAVIEKYATDKGREAADPLFSVEGDMLLFLFALAGAIGGFIMGYYWHKVFVVEKPDSGDSG